MKKILTSALLITLMTSACAQQVTQLPKPDMIIRMSLTEALQNRKTDREFSDMQITDQQLSMLLWATCGVNRADRNLLTIPTATNAQDIIAYVCRANGVELYNPQQNTLTKVSDQDIRPLLAERQMNMVKAPVFILIVSDQSKFRGNAAHYGAMDAGYASQDIYLMCAALGLKTVARAMMNYDAVKSALNLPDNIALELNHPIGY